MRATRSWLGDNGLPSDDVGRLPASTKRFADGAQYRVEIPSVEGPAVLDAVFAEADARGLTVHRVSQGSGGMLLTDDELGRMAALAADRDVEVSIFARPTAGWGVGAMARSAGGSAIGSLARGEDGLVACLADIRRIAAHGIRSALVSDMGVLRLAGRMRSQGHLPQDMQFKASVLMACANPASIRLAEELGADTYNVSTDVTLAELAEIRRAVDLPLDVYVESPDELGGFVRHYEIPEIIRVAAPVYLKFGLSNSPPLYPSGTHLQPLAISLARERVRRAQIGLELLARHSPGATQSRLPAKGLAVPHPRAQGSVESSIAQSHASSLA